jgi:hypothetical protein
MDHRPDNAEQHGHAEPGDCSLRVIRRAAVALANQGEQDVADDDDQALATDEQNGKEE